MQYLCNSYTKCFFKSFFVGKISQLSLWSRNVGCQKHWKCSSPSEIFNNVVLELKLLQYFEDRVPKILLLQIKCRCIKDWGKKEWIFLIQVYENNQEKHFCSFFCNLWLISCTHKIMNGFNSILDDKL